MKLTGKAKAKFEEWYNSDGVPMTYPHFDDFCMLPEAAQWGVIQDWADSIGVRIDIVVFYDRMLGYVRGYEVKVNDDNIFNNGDVFETRQEARNAAIEKLNELINEQ